MNRYGASLMQKYGDPGGYDTFRGPGGATRMNLRDQYDRMYQMNHAMDMQEYGAKKQHAQDILGLGLALFGF